MRGCSVIVNRLIDNVFWLSCKDERKKRNDRLSEGDSIFPYIKNIPSFLKKMVMFLRNLKVFFENIKVFFWLSRFLAGIIFYTREVLLTSHYEKRLFEHASQPRVACQILDYFLISGVEQTSQEIHISLDEKMNSKLSNDVHFESKGFMQHGSVSKLNRAIPSSAVGARFTRPKTVCFVSSGRQTLPLGTKRQHCPHFDTSPCL